MAAVDAAEERLTERCSQETAVTQMVSLDRLGSPTLGTVDPMEAQHGTSFPSYSSPGSPFDAPPSPPAILVDKVKQIVEPVEAVDSVEDVLSQASAVSLGWRKLIRSGAQKFEASENETEAEHVRAAKRLPASNQPSDMPAVKKRFAAASPGPSLDSLEPLED